MSPWLPLILYTFQHRSTFQNTLFRQLWQTGGIEKKKTTTKKHCPGEQVICLTFHKVIVHQDNAQINNTFADLLLFKHLLSWQLAGSHNIKRCIQPMNVFPQRQELSLNWPFLALLFSPPGEWDRDKRSVWVSLWVGVQWGGISGCGGSGPARLFPDTES